MRELEIARMIASGLTDKEIDYQPGIEVSTVRTHSNRIFSKARRTPPKRRRQGFENSR
jgi:DNA-binding NarL/FixJ family response regulator